MNKHKKTVLIVDDSLLIMERMIPILEEIDNISFVVQAGSFREAVEVLRTLNPDMVLLDINLPDKSGIDLLHFIRAKQMEITVLMITNQTDSYYMEICHKLGAKYFLDKSKDIDLISGVLATAC
ncbi:MAG TPA: response regulator transcription factor [Puia sp.]|nr:response regulator transcription factor [Puia sp.]